MWTCHFHHNGVHTSKLVCKIKNPKLISLFATGDLNMPGCLFAVIFFSLFQIYIPIQCSLFALVSDLLTSYLNSMREPEAICHKAMYLKSNYTNEFPLAVDLHVGKLVEELLVNHISWHKLRLGKTHLHNFIIYS